MKIRITFIYPLISFFILSSYSCIKKTEEDKTSDSEKRVVVNQNNGIVKLFGFEEQEMDKQLYYLVRNGFEKTTTLQQLKAANTINDIIAAYPTSWISDYISVDITTINNGEKRTVTSDNEVLTKEQKELLSQTNESSDVLFLAHYKAENSVTGEIQHREMNFSMTVIPETKAEFTGGYDKMIAYLESNSAKKIEQLGFSKLDVVSVSFTVNKMGKTEHIIITKPSGYDKVDSLLIKLIKDMPQWSPAKNKEGNAVDQHFFLDIQKDNC